MRIQITEWKIEDATIKTADGIAFQNSSIEVEIQREFPNRYTKTDHVSGTIYLDQTVSDWVFHDEQGIPRTIDLVAQNDEKQIELGALLVADDSGGSEFDFVACSPKKTEFENEDKEKKENRPMTTLKEIEAKLLNLQKTIVGDEPETSYQEGFRDGIQHSISVLRGAVPVAAAPQPQEAEEGRGKTVELELDGMEPFEKGELRFDAEVDYKNGGVAEAVARIELLGFEATADLGDLFELKLSSDFTET